MSQFTSGTHASDVRISRSMRDKYHWSFQGERVFLYATYVPMRTVAFGRTATGEAPVTIDVLRPRSNLGKILGEM